MNFGSILRRLLSRSWRRPRSEHLVLGERGEREAARFLKARGHRVLARNFAGPGGEIDLITAHGGDIVFVEVKTRRSDRRQDPIDAVGSVKQGRLIRTARQFLAQQGQTHRTVRFDVVTVIWGEDGRPEIEHHEDAFQP